MTVDCWYPSLMKETISHFFKNGIHITFLSSGVYKKQISEIVFVFKSVTAPPPSSTLFSFQFSYFVFFPCLFFFFFCLFFLCWAFPRALFWWEKFLAKLLGCSRVSLKKVQVYR